MKNSLNCGSVFMLVPSFTIILSTPNTLESLIITSINGVISLEETIFFITLVWLAEAIANFLYV